MVFVCFRFFFSFVFMGSFVHWNCRGVRTKSHWLKVNPFVSAVGIFLQESFLSPSFRFCVSQRSIYRVDRVSGRGGGVVNLLNDNFTTSSCRLPSTAGYSIEAVGNKIWDGSRCITVVNVYIPDGVFPRPWFDDLLKSISPPLMILGDFNINMIRRDLDSSVDVSHCIDWILASGLCILNTKDPTRTQLTCQSVIDLSIVSADLFPLIQYYVHPDLFDSDHHPVVINLRGWFEGGRRVRMVRYVKWRNAGQDLNVSLESIDDVNVECFQSMCEVAIDGNYTCTGVNTDSSPPWWDTKCRWLLGQKRKFLRLARARCCKDAWLDYKRSAAQLRRLVKQRSRSYWQSICSSAASGKGIYRILRALNRESDNPVATQLSLGGCSFTSREDQANAFLRVFCSGPESQIIPVDLSGNAESLNMDICIEELTRAIQTTRPTSPGEDGISVKLLRALQFPQLQKLLAAFNKCFSSCHVPQSWRTCVIVPVRKPGKTCREILSYRPIALTPVLCKIFERILVARLQNWILVNKALDSNLYGFIPYRDCQTALCHLYDDIRTAREHHKFVFAVCMDIKSAYDSVWRDGLVYKMVSLGVVGKIALWIQCYLSNRKCKVKWRGFVTGAENQDIGVPQGGVLSPLLFMLFMHDVFETAVGSAKIFVYADDVFILSTDGDADRALGSLQDTMRRFQQWCDFWHFQVSPDKCNAINFSRRKVKNVQPLYINGAIINWVDSVRILGFHFAKSLSCQRHIRFLRKKALYRVNLIRAIAHPRYGITSYHLLRINNSLIRSLCEFGSPILVNCTMTDFGKLEVLYNAGLRVALGLPRCTPIPVLRREAGQLSIQHRIEFLGLAFGLRQLALREWSFVGNVLQSGVSSGCWGGSAISGQVAQFMRCTVGGVVNILPMTWSSHCRIPNLRFDLDCHMFQDRSNPQSEFPSLFAECLYSSFNNYVILATDASKDDNKVAVAAVSVTYGLEVAMLCPLQTSVFTAEAIALVVALDQFARSHQNIVVCSDSLSVLKALQRVNRKSSSIINRLYQVISQVCESCNSLVLLWTPGHVGIPPNERADRLAKEGPFCLQSFPFLCVEDAVRVCKTEKYNCAESEWRDGSYFSRFSYLASSSRWSSWVRSRQADVIVHRWRTRTVMTRGLLYRMRLVSSPLCSFCQVVESAEHVLLHCLRYDVFRMKLLQGLGLGVGCSYADVVSVASASRRGVRWLVWFSVHLPFFA